MKKILIFIMLLLATAPITTKAEETIVIVGGWSRTGTTEEIARQLTPMKKALEEAGHRVVVIRPKTHIPLSTASSEIYDELKKEDIFRGDIVFVGWCWGGLISRHFAEQYIGEVNIKAIIQIASPNRGYWFSPQFLFYTDAEKSKEIPLFIIAGNKSEKKWFLRSENDGTVDSESVLSILAKEQIVFPLSHLELIASQEVADKVITWIGSYDQKNID